ncbi:hypothetical protein FIBSPDRAFT_1050529 [Athelia psychrophila]|uniref:Heme haloperoxidase family profile domain-containing protein n=1 Tax=Athelia psychrophila TaxID=1759441 RepID=A0A166AP50_9AGAM|nr:hypothetical protein FIBSPDRAFT_1050529 [Fibularhizoctonia sp. CBS 109695]
MIYFPPQTGDVRSLLPALGPVAGRGHLPPRKNEDISLLTLARALQAGYTLSSPRVDQPRRKLGTSNQEYAPADIDDDPVDDITRVGDVVKIVVSAEQDTPLALKRCLQSGFLTPLSLSGIVTPDRIEHDMSLAHRNMLWEEQYAPFQATRGQLMQDEKHDLMNAEHVAKSRVRAENASPTLDGLQAEAARGDGHRLPRIRRSLFSLVFSLSHHRRGNTDPLHHLRAWIQNRTLPGGGSRAGELG